MRYIYLVYMLLFIPACHSVEVSLNDATYSDGILSTDTGGIITTPELQMQGRHIRYTNRSGEKKLEAWKDILVTFNDKVFVGDHIFYDCISKKGVIEKGKLSVDIWHVSGSRIELYPDDTYKIFDATITTSEKENPFFSMGAERIDIEKNFLSAKSLQMQWAGHSYLLLPSYSMNLQRLWRKPSLQYRVFWDKGIGPCGMIRYRAYTSKHSSSHLRFDMRFHRGEKPILRLGSLLESEYFFSKERGKLCTKNYLGYDTPFNDPNSASKFRYRLQGIASYRSSSGNQTLFSRWDKISDRNMPNDFHMEKFELSTEKKTELRLRNFHKRVITNISFVPKVNSFDSIKQELPEIKLSPYPIILSQSGVVFENSLRVGYYRYSFARDSRPCFLGFDSSRLQYSQTLYRTFSSPYLTITPIIGCHYALYGKTSTHRSVPFCFPFVDISIYTRLVGSSSKVLHSIEPYAKIYSLHPLQKKAYPFIFDLSDGLRKINSLRCGVRNIVCMPEQTSMVPFLSIDTYALSFFHPSPFSKTFPKVFTRVECNLPRLSIKTLLGWNTEYSVLDVGKVRASFTCNADVALSAEFRFRGPMAWKKNNPENYMVDVTRSPFDLTHSLLSDARKVAMMRMQFKVHPQWIVRLDGNYGWGRKSESGHFVGKIDLLGLVSSNLRIKVSYVQAASRSRFEFGVDLVRF